MKLIKTLGVASLSLFFMQGCDLFGSAKEKIEAELSKSSAADETDECASYREKYKQTGNESWRDIYETECLDAFVASNTPEGLDDGCKADYKSLVTHTDSVVAELAGVCDTNPEDAKCVDAEKAIEERAEKFQKDCDTDEFYYATIDEAGPDQKQIDGQCYWETWIPPETRQEGQPEMIDTKCLDKPPECTQEFLNGKNQFVEKHEAVDGSTVYLPCVEQFLYTENPCDFNGDGVADPVELRKCEEEGKVSDPCDFNGDGKVDDFEANQCSWGSEDGFIDPSKYDPCDWNYDGIVDQWEGEQCAMTYNCEADEMLLWDVIKNQDVCISMDKVPADCHPPKWIEAVDGEALCIDPCDMNRDGEVDESEEGSCNFIDCGPDAMPMWDNEKMEDVCIDHDDMPMCKGSEWPELLDGEVICVDPCDMNRDGSVDAWEKENCAFVTCDAGEMPLWDHKQQKNICVEEIFCDYPTWPELDPESGKAMCVDPCDWNFDGVVDEYESTQCNSSPTPMPGPGIKAKKNLR